MHDAGVQSAAGLDRSAQRGGPPAADHTAAGQKRCGQKQHCQQLTRREGSSSQRVQATAGHREQHNIFAPGTSPVGVFQQPEEARAVCPAIS